VIAPFRTPGYRYGKPFDAFVEALREAVATHRMGIVADALK
jgi:hypothetical protein